MSAQAGNSTVGWSKRKVRIVVSSALAFVVLAAMALDTTVIRIGSDADVRKQAFSPEAYGAAQFPIIQAAIEAKAVDAAELFAAISKDKAAAAKQYGVPTSIGPEFAVKFTGVVGDGKSGVFVVNVPGVSETVQIRVQTGPAINGTDLRDSTGTIKFGQFTNQIEYQDAGSALNKEMKKQVLSKIDNTALTGKTVSVVGVFQLINPKGWFVTPVRFDVQ